MARVTITLTDRKGKRGGVIKKVVTHFEDGEEIENTPAVAQADKMLKAIGMGVGVGDRPEDAHPGELIDVD